MGGNDSPKLLEHFGVLDPSELLINKLRLEIDLNVPPLGTNEAAISV